MPRKNYHDYEADVVYEVWRSGGNVDALNSDRVRDCYDYGMYQDETADMILRSQYKESDDFGEDA